MRGKLIGKLGRSALGRSIGRWRRDRRGIAAVEFAFVVPVLLVSYLGAIEIGQAIDVNKKVGRAASMTADLITQESDVDVSQVRAIMDIGNLVLEPFTSRFDLTVEVTAIEVTDEASPKTKVVWSQELDAGSYSVPFAKGSITTLPTNLTTPGSFIVRVKSSLQYRPIISWVLSKRGGKIDMEETYYLRPRVTSRIDCSNCP